MLSKNFAIERGHLADTPVYRVTSTGLAVAELRLAADRPLNADTRAANRAAGVDDPVDWINVRLFGDRVAQLKAFDPPVGKGDLMEFTGSIRTDRWQPVVTCEACQHTWTGFASRTYLNADRFDMLYSSARARIRTSNGANGDGNGNGASQPEPPDEAEEPVSQEALEALAEKVNGKSKAAAAA